MPLQSLIYNTELYEIVPGFICSLLAGVIVSLCTKKPDKEVEELFESAKQEIEDEPETINA
jgi:Na+/proline symporter